MIAVIASFIASKSSVMAAAEFSSLFHHDCDGKEQCQGFSEENALELDNWHYGEFWQRRESRDSNLLAATVRKQ